MYYTVYKIINLINDKIYIGVHKTSNIDDGYMGSGKDIKKDINKYGIANFRKEYLAIFDNESEMFHMESRIVDNDFVKSEKTYNLTKGGYGGWAIVNEKASIESKRIAGSWKDIEKRREIRKSIPIEKRREIGRKLGNKFGGQNVLTKEEIETRLKKIENVNLLEYGWVNKISKILEITHTQVKRFIEKYYRGEYYRRK